MPIWDTIVAESGRGTLTAERRWLQNNLLTPLADHMPDEQITPRMLRDLGADPSFQTFLSRWRTMTKPITPRLADDIIYRIGEVLREAHDQHVESSTLYSADELLAFAINRLPRITPRSFPTCRSESQACITRIKYSLMNGNASAKRSASGGNCPRLPRSLRLHLAYPHELARMTTDIVYVDVDLGKD